ncbi:hypothetical protein [Flavobacterium sp. LB1P71]|uniref:hypothetical protein n=1 Tax=Flavobacterium sp. LB1P71 TaxID=3401716 RepID=UPI003AAE9016
MKTILLEIQKEFKSNPILFIRENLSLIIGIPTLLGGLWQVVELSRLSFSYLRFFSISQIVPDGLLIISVIIILWLILYWYVIIFRVEDDENKELLKENLKTKSPFPKYITLLLILIYFTIIVYNLIAIYKFPIYSIIGFIMNIICTVIMSAIAFSIIEYTSLRSHVKYKENISGLKGLIIIPLLYTCYSLSTGFHNTYVFPKELINIENIKCYIERNKGCNVKIKINYLNDKYIFLNVSEYTFKENKLDTIFISNQSQIIPFETILDENSCITIKEEKQKIQDSIQYRIKQKELSSKLLDSFNKTK